MYLVFIEKNKKIALKNFICIFAQRRTTTLNTLLDCERGLELYKNV